jgi:hypothetical protein
VTITVEVPDALLDDLARVRRISAGRSALRLRSTCTAVAWSHRGKAPRSPVGVGGSSFRLSGVPKSPPAR